MNFAIIVKGYPRLSETFVAQELLELQNRNLTFTIISLRHPTDDKIHPISQKILAPVVYLPEYLHQEPLRVARSLFRCVRRPGFLLSLRLFMGDLRRDFTSNRVRRFGQALVLAGERENIGFYYAHFIHTPASVARYASVINKTEWACSAHAKDIWTSPDWEISEKLAHCDWVVTCTGSNMTHLRTLCNDPDKVHLAYHGLDFKRFPLPANKKHSRDGGDAGKKVQILSVGRAVEKKGFQVLLNALATLPGESQWNWTHIGGGPLLGQLKEMAAQLDISEKIRWMGPRNSTEVLECYRQADIFVLPSVIDSKGDRDGLPNVLMEAQSQLAACISTSISGIPELIEADVTGLLVESGQVAPLGEALLKLIHSPATRKRLSDAAAANLLSQFSLTKGMDTVECNIRRSLQRASVLNSRKRTSDSDNSDQTVA